MKSKVDFAPQQREDPAQQFEDHLAMSKRATGRMGLASSELNDAGSVKMNRSTLMNRSGLRDSHAPSQVQAPKSEGRLNIYENDEDELPCMRFKHKKYCGCDHKCYEAKDNDRFKPTPVGLNNSD